MPLLIRILWLALLVSLPNCAAAKPAEPSQELTTVYKKICDLENRIPNVEDPRVDFEEKFIAVNAYWDGNKDAHYALCRQFWRLIPDQDSVDPTVVKEKQRVIAELHRQNGASFTSIAALASNLRGPAADHEMKAYVRSHPDLPLTRFAAWMLRRKAKRTLH